MDCHTKFPTADADRGRPLSSVRATCVAPPVAVHRAPSGLMGVPRDGFDHAFINGPAEGMGLESAGLHARRFRGAGVDFSRATRGAMISVTRDVVTDLTGGGPKIVQVRRV